VGHTAACGRGRRGTGHGWRPGDRFDQNEEEIRLKDDPYWIYR
jgi:hypothetical protein